MSDVRDPERDQAAPTPNDRPSAHDLVREDLLERKEHGLRKYGTLLQAGNGRNPLLDVYEELMDAVVYAKTALIEQEEDLTFHWDKLDREPKLSAQCIFSAAPMTALHLQALTFRQIAGQITAGAEDEKIAILKDAGFDDWLNNLASQAYEQLEAMIAESTPDPDPEAA